MRTELVAIVALCSVWLAAPGSDAARPQGQPSDESLVLRGGTIVTGTGSVIENGTIVIRDGTIAVVGGKDSAVPAGIRTIDVSGKFLLPGFIDGFSSIGTSEIASFGSDEDEAVDPVTPHLRVIDALNPDNRFIALARKEGITAALTAPGEGNLFPGRGAVIRLTEGTMERMLVRFPAGVHITVGEAPKLRYGAKSKAPGTRMGEIALLRQTLTDAQQYMEKKASAKQPVAVDLKLEALVPALKGELPVVVSADKREDILAAIRVTDEFHLKMILSHGTEAFRVTEELWTRKIPVLLGPGSQAGMRLETMRSQEDSALLLNKAGIAFAFQTGVKGNPRELLQQARISVAHGLPQEVALRALTAGAAEILGVADRVGSLQPGRMGDVLVFDSDPLRNVVLPKMVIVGGKVY
jgi:imidazolonepropionase-like amidohydrolase